MRTSIQNKIITLILVGILFSSFTIGSLGMYSFREELEKSVISTMNLTCQEKTELLNSMLGRIEQSTEVMAVLAANHLEQVDLLMDEEYREDYVEHLCNVGHDVTMNTDGTIGIYFRLNPHVAGTTDGFYWLVDEETGVPQLDPTADGFPMEMNDAEYIEWYIQPLLAGESIWKDPYYNENIERVVVSYITPVYKENQLVGVFGMDVDWSYITNMIDEIKIYDTGYAFLTDENLKIAYSKEFEAGTDAMGLSEEFANIETSELVRSDRVFELQVDGHTKVAAFTKLSNGKIMAVMAPKSEISAGFHALLLRILTIVLITGAVFVLITMQIAKSIIRPLRELDKAAQDIAQGNWDVDLHMTSNDEVGTLAESFRETARQLKMKINYINNLAFTDKLTGIKNNTAYLQEVAFLRNDILQKKASFSLFVIDANGLKFINDNYGHELGNELLIKVTQMLSEVFGDEQLYRIGGDEFAVIRYNTSEEECLSYEKRFEEILTQQTGRLWAAASVGHATYNAQIDATYESVFNRADEDMYENKVRTKAAGKTSRVLE